LGLGDHHVDLTAEVLRDHAAAVGELSELVATRSDEGTELGTSWVIGISQLEVGADLGFSGVLKRDGRERLDVQVGAFGARLDELGSKSEDSAGLKGSIKSSGNRFGGRSDTDESLVTSLNGHNGGGGGENIGGVDKGSSTEVGRNTNSLEDTGSGDHGLCIRESGVEVVLAWLHRLSTCAGDGALESSDVSSLSHAHTHQRLDLSIRETESLEVSCGELGETLFVKLGLEMLCCEGKLENVHIGKTTSGGSCCGSCRRRGRGSGRGRGGGRLAGIDAGGSGGGERSQGTEAGEN